MDAVTQDDMDDFYIQFEVIPQKPVFEIVGGTDMIGKDPWTMASDFIINHAMSRPAASMITIPMSKMSIEDIYGALLHDLAEDLI